ncbi:MAG: Na+/solute symporter [Peptococcaceae bacterium]|jgi:SSS family solute:Na+ symporter|nr:Na+/solute symporter [Peptococcaceae bacterium]
MNKSLIYLVFFTLYTILILSVGKYGISKTKSSRDFYVAGNSLGLSLSIFTFAATWLSAASMQGLTGSIYTYGYSAALYAVIGWFLGASLLVILAVRLKDYDIVTIPEFFRIRYGSRLFQAMGGAIIIVSYIFYIMIQIRGFGIVMTQLLDIPYTLSIFLVYLFILYTTFGGLYSVARTDAVNFILIVMGTLVALSLVMGNLGDITEIHRQAMLIDTKPFQDFATQTPRGSLLDPFAYGLHPPLLIVTVFFGWGLGLAANPQYAIRIISAQSKEVALKMIGLSVLVLAFIYICLILIGIGSRVLVPSLTGVSSVDEIFPYIINNILYSRWSGFVLISLIATAISTANSQLLLVASGFSHDIYKNYLNPQAEEDKLLFVNRVFICIGGTLALLLSITPPLSLLTFGGHVWGIFSSTFLVPLYGGVFWHKATKEGAIASFCGGLTGLTLFYLVSLYLRGKAGFLDHITVHPAVFGVFVSFVLFYVVSVITYQKEGKKIEN